MRGSFHKSIERPVACPNCGISRSLAALGYYTRHVTHHRKIVAIVVRRFRCKNCGKTTSILPCFAQPYRLVANAAIEAFFFQPIIRPDDPWSSLLKAYWIRFADWIPELSKALSTQLMRSPPPISSAPEWWDLLRTMFGCLEVMTRTVVSAFRITIFGRYQCHFPNTS